MRFARIASVAWILVFAGCREPEPWRADDRLAAAGDRVPFRAGVASAEFTPPTGYPLAGYGGSDRREEWPLYFGLGWPGRLALSAHQAWHENDPDPDARHDMLAGATGTHDPLLARALVLRPEGAPPMALVRLDLLAVTAELHARVADGVRDLGFRASTLILCATHTHSGPGAFMRAAAARLSGSDNFRPEIEDRIAQAAVEAIREAHATAVPAAIGVATLRDRGPNRRPVLAKNRRSRTFPGQIRPDWIDDEVLLLRVDRREGGMLGLAVFYAVHPTLLGDENLLWSADLTGGIERALEASVGAPVLFVNGAEGDVGPRRPRADDPFERVEMLGAAFAGLVAPVATGALPTSPLLRVSAAEKTVDLGPPATLLAWGREPLLDAAGGSLSQASTPFVLPFNLLLWSLGLTNLRVDATLGQGLGLVLDLGAYVDRTTTRVGGVRLETSRDDLVLLTLPGEATHDVGLATKAAARARGATRASVVGMALDHVGYIASEVEYRRGGYEAHMTLFGPGEAARIAEAHEDVLDALFPAPR
jgi:hypothetical protein